MVAFLEGPDLLIVVAILLLVFGGSKIPQLARSLGEAQREFRKASEDDHGTPDATKVLAPPHEESTAELNDRPHPTPPPDDPPSFS
jgi:sec-independent protein translocase protein TatA